MGFLTISYLPKSNSGRDYLAPYLLSSKESPEPINFIFQFLKGFALDTQKQTLLLKKPIKKHSYCKSKSSAFKIIFFAFTSNHYFKIEVINPSLYFFLSSLLQYLLCTPGQLDTSVRKERYLCTWKYEALSKVQDWM